MSKLASKPFAFLSISVFVFGLATFTAFSFQGSAKVHTEPDRPFKLVLIESEITPNGVETIKKFKTQEVDADGNFIITGQPADQEAAVEYTRTPEGVFATKGDKKLSLGQSPRSPEMLKKMHTTEFYENHPNLVGTDVVAGIKVYRIRVALEQKGGWLEMNNSPITGATPLRIIIHKPDGSEHKIEAVKVEFKDSSDK